VLESRSISAIVKKTPGLLYELMKFWIARFGAGEKVTLNIGNGLKERLDHVLAQARDGYHQIGTTRMAENEKLGIVDSRCRVHGLKNLYVAGSAVFPTSGRQIPLHSSRSRS